MNPGFSIGPVHVYYYGLILALALLVGYLYARRRAPRYGVPVALIDSALLVATPLAIVGARLYYVLFSWDFYRLHPELIWHVQDGGLAIHGVLLGGLVGFLLVWWRYRAHDKKNPLRFSAILDVLAPVLPLSQAIGRVANYVNHEAFGRPTDLPFGIYIPPQQRPPQFASDQHFHPTFAYEALWNLVGLALVLWVERKLARKHRGSSGVLFAIYLGWYSLGRFWIEALRTDALLLGGTGGLGSIGPLKIAQIVSAAAAVGSLAYICYRLAQWHRSSGRKNQTPTQAPSAS